MGLGVVLEPPCGNSVPIWTSTGAAGCPLQLPHEGEMAQGGAQAPCLQVPWL